VEIKSEIMSLQAATEEVWNANRRLDNAICGPGGVIPTLEEGHVILKRIYYALLILIILGILLLLK
jgi:hypothetical protein